MIPLVIASIYFGVIGAAVTAALRMKFETRFEWVAASMLHGIGAVGLLGQVVGATGLPLTRGFFVALFVVALIALFFARPSWPSEPKSGRSMLVRVATVVTLVPMAVLLIDTVTTPLHDYDGRVIWMLKARAIAREGTITGPFFRGEGARNAHSQYPLLMPIVSAAMFDLTGDDDDHNAKPVYALIAAAFLVVLRGAMVRLSDVRVASVVTAAVAWLPHFAADSDGGMFSAYSDVSLIAFVSLALLSIFGGDAFDRPLAFGLQLSFLVCIKNEGVVFALVLLGIAIAIRPVRGMVIATGTVILTVAALLLWRSHVPLEYDENYPRLMLNVFRSLGNYPAAARELLVRMVDLRSWGAFWIVALFASAAALAARKSRRVAVSLLVAIACVLFVYVTTYAVTNWSMSELAVSSAHRLLLHLVPFAALLLAVGTASFTEPRDTVAA